MFKTELDMYSELMIDLDEEKFRQELAEEVKSISARIDSDFKIHLEEEVLKKQTESPELLKLKNALNSLVAKNSSKRRQLELLTSSARQLQFAVQRQKTVRVPGKSAFCLDQRVSKYSEKIKNEISEAKTLKLMMNSMQVACNYHKRQLIEIESVFKKITKFHKGFSERVFSSRNNAVSAITQLNNNRKKVVNSRSKYNRSKSQLLYSQRALSSQLIAIIEEVGTINIEKRNNNALKKEKLNSLNTQFAQFEKSTRRRERTETKLFDIREQMSQLEKSMGKSQGTFYNGLTHSDMREIIHYSKSSHSKEVSLKNAYKELLLRSSLKKKEAEAVAGELGIYRDAAGLPAETYSDFSTANLMISGFNSGLSRIGTAKTLDGAILSIVFSFSQLIGQYILTLERAFHFMHGSEYRLVSLVESTSKAIGSITSNRKPQNEILTLRDFPSIQISINEETDEHTAISLQKIEKLYLLAFPCNAKESDVFLKLFKDNQITRYFLEERTVSEYLESETAETALQNVHQLYAKSNKTLTTKLGSLIEAAVDLLSTVTSCTNDTKQALSSHYSGCLHSIKASAPRPLDFYSIKPLNTVNQQKRTQYKERVIYRPLKMSPHPSSDGNIIFHSRQSSALALSISDRNAVLREAVVLDRRMQQFNYETKKAEKDNLSLSKIKIKSRNFSLNNSKQRPRHRGPRESPGTIT